jgi:hypothetical protein
VEHRTLGEVIFWENTIHCSDMQKKFAEFHETHRVSTFGSLVSCLVPQHFRPTHRPLTEHHRLTVVHGLCFKNNEFKELLPQLALLSYCRTKTLWSFYQIFLKKQIALVEKVIAAIGKDYHKHIGLIVINFYKQT